jgi:hypothetical protein
MVEDGLVVVALWLAETPLEVFWSPVPTFTPGLMFAPALTSVLLMPTFASTPTLGFTFTPPEADVEPLGAGCEVVGELVVLWSVDVVWANAGPNAPITAAAVILTASCLTLMCSPFRKVLSTPAASAVPRLCLSVKFPTFR